MRTHTCGELREAHIGSQTRLCGWVHRSRHIGKLLLIELRDRYGRTQLLFEQGKCSKEVWQTATDLSREDVIQALGEVITRQEPNDNLSTGQIEVRIDKLTKIAASALPPFIVDDPTDGGEPLRLQYRYLDLRRPSMQRMLGLRHRLAQAVRRFLDDHHFIEVETPQLVKQTPEGARDFLVPSRLHPDEQYALPQSPQLFKQLLMVAGLDRYYQLARCFRDEDHRSDRQPEFTQLDCELSFVNQEDILSVFEALIIHVFTEVIGYELPAPFPRLSYADARTRYGTDKPDLRYALHFVPLPPLTKLEEALPFLKSQPVEGLLLPAKSAEISRRQLDKWRALVGESSEVKTTLSHVRILENGELESPLLKNIEDKSVLAPWIKAMKAQAGDLLLILVGSTDRQAAGALCAAAQTLYAPKETYKAMWVLNFPLFERNPEDGRLSSMHHPFTQPRSSDLALLQTAPESVGAEAYDLVINGVEVGGGSLRITSAELQKQVFALLGYGEEEINQQFGFLLSAFRYGVPPHGGIALGFDRLCALLASSATIRDCIAFPKNTAGRDMMLGAPGPVALDP